MDTKPTVAELRERLSRDINDIDAALSLGNYYYDIGEAGLSINYYRRVLDINPDMSGVRTDLGTMYWRNNDIGLSEEAFREVIARDPGFGHAYVNLGLLLQRAKGDDAGARVVWQQFLDIAPDHEVAGKARELLQQPAPSGNDALHRLV